MPKTKHSPVKLLSDLGIDVMNLSSQEDYKSALIEGLAKLQYTGETSSERFKILANEVRRVKTEQEKAKDPTYKTKEERPPIVKKTKITGKAFKKGSSVGRAENVAADTTGASAIQKWQPQAGAPLQQAEDVTPQAQPTESLIGALKSIDSGVNNIIETLKGSNKADAKAQSDERKRLEKEAREQKEGKLEGIKGKLANAADTVLAPVKSIFQKIWDFLKVVILGRVVMKLFEWFTNPANGEKIAALFKFLKDWWPVLVAGIMAVVGPGMIFTAGLIALLVWGIPKIIEAVNWVKNLFGIGIDKELKNVETDADKFAQDTAKGLGKESGEVVPGSKGMPGTKGKVGGETEELPNTDVDPNIVGETQQQATDLQDAAAGIETLPVEMAGGGEVPGSGTGDTVPAMLTPGEFVMSRGAVNRYGANTLAGMNAAAGGTNRPTRGGYLGGGVVNNVSGYRGGGVVKNVSNTSSGISLGGPKINYGGSRTILNVPRTVLPSQPLKFAGGGSVPEAQIVKGSPSQIVINPPVGSSPEVITADPVGDANAKLSAQATQSQDLPSFSASSMRSISKIKTLGITV